MDKIVALLAEGVGRKPEDDGLKQPWDVVALLAEGVGRNHSPICRP